MTNKKPKPLFVVVTIPLPCPNFLRILYIRKVIVIMNNWYLGV